MKFPLIVLMLVIFSISTEAQTNNSLVFGKAIVKYQTMEKAGTVLTALGGVALFTGNILYWKIYNNRNFEDSSIGKAHTYRNIMYGGLGLMAIGVPLWSIGRSNERHITIEARVVRFNGYVAANGVGLKVRF
jgi:protein-S-isoprenylcysteine O-methyltransferase Ste14